MRGFPSCQLMAVLESFLFFSLGGEGLGAEKAHPVWSSERE